jgi:hypothetical protein
MGTEAVHRALVRNAQNELGKPIGPPNDVGFESFDWKSLTAVRTALEGLGIGYGVAVAQPGRLYDYPGDPLASGVGTPSATPRRPDAAAGARARGRALACRATTAAHRTASRGRAERDSGEYRFSSLSGVRSTRCSISERPAVPDQVRELRSCLVNVMSAPAGACLGACTWPSSRSSQVESD